jgi:peroxiredoxin
MFHFKVQERTGRSNVMASDLFRMRVWKVSAMAVMMMVACVLLLPWDAHSFGPGGVKPPFLEKAPGFVLKDLEGKSFRLSDFKGKKPVLIIFGATWCGYCREEIPHFKALHATYAKQGLEIVNIDSQESKERVAKFAARYELPYRVLLDEDGAVAGIYEIPGVPVMVLVDKNGNIVCRMCRQVEPLIELLLKRK